MNRIVTDNTKTLANALDRIKALESLLARCGDRLNMYNNFTAFDIRDTILEIDAILPATEGKKDEK